MTAPVIAGHFGEFGGRFVPEALMHALDQLESAYLAAKESPDFTNELAVLQKITPAGQPRSLMLNVLVN